MNNIRKLTEQQKRSAESYLANVRRLGLKSDVRNVVASIEQQFLRTGWISIRQLDVLRRCCLVTNMPNPMGGFKSRVSYGR